MKTAKLFFICIYTHLILSIAVPIGMFFISQRGWDQIGMILVEFYFLMVVVVHIVGWISVGAAVSAYRREEYDQIRKAWKLLKLGTIPFYILNFLYSFFIWFLLVGASRGILIILVPIPIIFTCLLIVESGCVGWCYIKYLRKRPKPENGRRPSRIHYLMQVVSVFDMISTVVLLRKYKEGGDIQ